MEIGTEYIIYCVYNSRLVKLKCEKNGNVNDDEVATACNPKQKNCIYNSTFGLLQNLRPTRGDFTMIDNTKKTNFACKSTDRQLPPMPKINGLFYEKNLDIRCNDGRFYIGNYNSQYNYGQEIIEIVECPSSF